MRVAGAPGAADDAPVARARAALDAALSAESGEAPLPELGGLGDDALEALLAAFADAHAEAALPLLTRLGTAGDRRVRRATRRALYRLAQRGIAPAPPPPPRPLVERPHERAARAWASGIDGTGSRALWIVFEGRYGALRLCSLLLNDRVGITDVAGGEITKKRLDRELAHWRESQKLPWVEIDPARALGLVAEALALHATAGSPTPAAFAPWQASFPAAPSVEPPARVEPADPALLERTASLLERPELASWFLEPDRVQSDAVELLETRESRLVLSDQLKAEREAAIVDRVIEREFDAPTRRLWARRLAETALVLDAAGSAEPAALARAAATALADGDAEPRRQPFVRALAERTLAIAGEVALGRLSLAEVSRTPRTP